MTALLNRAFVENLIVGAAPEMRHQLTQFFTAYGSQIVLQQNSTGLAFKARGNRVLVTEKTLSHDWLLAYAAWRAFCAYSPPIFLALSARRPLTPAAFANDPDLPGAEAELHDLLYTASVLRAARDTDDVLWPVQVPRPQATGEEMNAPDRATFDLLCIGMAASFLHELSHARYAALAERPSPIDEERKSDEFARQFLTQNAGEYAAAVNQPVDAVLRKRAMGLSIAAYIIHEQTPPAAQQGSDTHPSSADRFRQLTGEVPVSDDAYCWVFAASLIMSILRKRNAFLDEVPPTTAKDLFNNLVAAL